MRHFSAKTFDELSTRELYEILRSRDEIFAVEQQINYIDEDGTDYVSLHCFIIENGRVEAYLRAYPGECESEIKLGRILTLHHGQGLGRELMEKSLEVIPKRFHCTKIVMDAQKHAADFYKKFGFCITSGEYLEEGIVHVDMELGVSSM